MKKKFKWVSAMLTMCILAITMTVVSCSDDDEKTNVWYALGFTEINTSSPDALREMGEIEAAYKKALGITESPFSKFGTVEECNQQVLNACQQAENALKEKKLERYLCIRDYKCQLRTSYLSKKFKANDDNALL